MKGFLEILLSLTLVLGLVPGMSMTAYAANYSEGDDASIFSISVGDTFDVGSTITRNNSAGVLQEIYVDDYCVFKYYGPGTYTVNENLTLTAVDGVKYYFDSTDTNDLTNATVTVDTAKASTTVKIGDKNVGPAKYDVKYGSTLENATADFPTQAGSYYAFVTAKETADNYIGEAKSAVFTISAADTVTWTSIANNKSENGITVTTSGVDFYGNYISGYNGSMTFTSTVGKIKKIEISCNGDHNMNVFRTSSGWNECSGSGPLVWNGTASDSVTLSARTIDIMEFAQIVYTIEAKSDISDTTVTVDTNNQRVSVTRGNAFIPEDEYTVTYGADAEHATITDFPTKAGTYVAVVTAKTDSTYYKGSVTSAEFTIPKADVLIVNLPVASAITYGQTLADSALTGGTAKSGDSEVEGIFEWKNKNIKPAVSDSEMTGYDVVFTPEDADNYAMVECKVKLTVNKAAPTITAPTAKTGLVYTSSAQKLVNTGSTNDGILYYAVTTENTAPTDDNLYSTSIPTGTDVGTYYVWYKAVGDETHTDSEAKCIAVTISSESSGGGGGGGGGGSDTPTSPTESYTVPVSGESTVNVTASISNETAVVSDISKSEIDKIIDAGNSTGTNENISVTIDLSQAKSEVTSVQLTKDTVEKLTEAVNAHDNLESVEIKMSKATVELDGKALSAVSEQAEGSSIKLVVKDTQTTKLNASQQESLKQFTSAQPFQAYFESKGKEIHDFKGGKATVSIKFSPETGKDVKYYHMYYLPLAGAIERYETRYIDGMLNFVTGHFSDYAIVYDETRKNETGKEDEDDNTDTDDNNGTDDGKTTEETSETTANGKTAYQNALSINKGLKVSQTGNKITVSWGKVSGADRYEIYAAYCTDKFGKKPVKIITKKDVTSVTITKLNGKKLVLTKNFKAYVVAYKTVDGSKKKLGKTITAHIVGRKNKTYTNVKAIKLAKNKTTIKVGKTYKIKASVVLVDSKKKMLSDKHAATFRYASSNKKIAAVDKNGKVIAKKVGTCYIWVYAKNGYAKKVKITVK